MWRIEPLFQLASSFEIETDNVEQPVRNIGFLGQRQSRPGERHVHDLDTEELAIERLPIDLDRKVDRLCHLESFLKQRTTLAQIIRTFGFVVFVGLLQEFGKQANTKSFQKMGGSP